MLPLRVGLNKSPIGDVFPAAESRVRSLLRLVEPAQQAQEWNTAVEKERDEDFSVQLEGRILRVHRTPQAKAAVGKLPEDLRYGYVFLADPAAQTGIDLAGQLTNRIQTE